MKNEEFILQHLVADEGKVFDWADLTQHRNYIIDDEGNETGEYEQEHLYAVEIFLAQTDSIDNYVEIDDPRVE